MSEKPKYPGTPEVINGNGAVTHVMKHVCGGVIGYPITPSTEISETFEAARAEGQLNVWGKHPFFVETEGEHSAQSGALGAALTGGNYVSNASSSQGILYALESHYVTVGKKIGGFVLQVAARVVSKHSLNVMAGHDDIYALLPSGYTVLFGSDPQEAADLAAISYRTAALSLIPVANTFDGFATSHVMSEVMMPEPELLKEYLGDPSGRIDCPTVAQEMLFGAKGRIFQLGQYLSRHRDDFMPADYKAIRAHLDSMTEKVEADDAGDLIEETLRWVPEDLHGQWKRAWLGAWRKGTRQVVPALVDPNNPGVTGAVQNQPDFQAGAVDHRTHFASAVPSLVRQAMSEYADLTGREYKPVMAYNCEDADVIMVGLGSITDDVRAVIDYERSRGIKAGVVSIKLLQPFPEAEFVDAIRNAKQVMVLERSEDTALTRFATQALFRAASNADRPDSFPGIPALSKIPALTTAIFGLGGHDVQPRHLIAAFDAMDKGGLPPVIYLGSQFFSANPSPRMAALQERLRAAYPETEFMALETGENPQLLPEGSLRIRFHSVGGYGTVATGKLLTDILAGVLNMHSKSAPKYGSEKSGAATNFYITLSPEKVLLTNNELEDVDIVVAPDHKVFEHSNPLVGLAEGGSLIMQSDKPALEVWAALPLHARKTIREKNIRFFVIDAFEVAKKHAPTPELETRMMGIAFIGAVIGNVDQISAGASMDDIVAKVREQITAKFGRKGEAVVEGNMAVIRDGVNATQRVDYTASEFLGVEDQVKGNRIRTGELSAGMCPSASAEAATALFDPTYYEDLAARPFREGTISEAPVLPGAGFFMPPATGLTKDKGIFRRTVPLFDSDACTGCLECALACPDAAIPNQVHEIHDLLFEGVSTAGIPENGRRVIEEKVYAWADRIRQLYRDDSSARSFADVAREAAGDFMDERAFVRNLDSICEQLALFPVARTRPFFDAMEKERPGSGGLFSAVVDPWKCTGCMQCVEVCGPATLIENDQTDVLAELLEDRFERMSALPNTPKRFTADAIKPDGDIKRMMLDHPTYYAMTGGHGACRGCGEVTATRLTTSLAHALGDQQRREYLKELDEVIAGLSERLENLDSADSQRRSLITDTIATLESQLYLEESGPTGNGPAPVVFANSTGCSSVYSSTMPFGPFHDPWVNSLFQDAQPLAVGLFEGLASKALPAIKAMRIAKAELAGEEIDLKALDTLGWRDLTSEELSILPQIFTVSGDGAAFDIGFGAMSRVLTGGTPIKAMVLDTGAYSNTGGQASTASYIGQDADLARFGKAHAGKRESRKELSLLASFHPNVFAASTSTALNAHYLDTAMRMLHFDSGTSLMHVYTPCGTENGFAENLSNARSRLAVESRMSPVFVHDPSAGESIFERFSLDGNPDVTKTWSTSTISYVDENGVAALMDIEVTPADFARGEIRWAKHFKRLKGDIENAMPVSEYVELDEESRVGVIPFVWATDKDKHLIQISCSTQIVALVEDRRHHWKTLQYLAGQREAELAVAHKAELAAVVAQYEEAVNARESSIDQIAATMVELATSSAPPAGPALSFGAGLGAGSSAEAAPAAAAPAPAGQGPIFQDEGDLPLCNDCGTCYQELPQLFEKATILVDGEPQVVGRLIANALETVEITDEMTKRMSRVKANCDAEILV